MLSQFYREPVNNWLVPVAASYSNGYTCPNKPSVDTGWALVQVNSNAVQIDAAAQDPRVQPYRTLWDPITADTVTAYASKGAKAGMMLGQLIQLLAQVDPGYAG